MYGMFACTIIVYSRETMNGVHMIIQYITTCHFSLAGNVQLMHRLYYTLIDLVNPILFIIKIVLLQKRSYLKLHTLQSHDFSRDAILNSKFIIHRSYATVHRITIV